MDKGQVFIVAIFWSRIMQSVCQCVYVELDHVFCHFSQNQGAEKACIIWFQGGETQAFHSAALRLSPLGLRALLEVCKLFFIFLSLLRIK